MSTSESSYHHQQSQSRYDSLRVIDLSVIHDTIAVLRTETLWREPDSLGNIYPLMTVNTESKARRHTDNNITTLRIDTLYISDNTNHIATETSKYTVEPSYQTRAPALNWLPWVLLGIGLLVIITVITIISIKKAVLI